MNKLIESYLSQLQAAGRSKHTIKSYSIMLRQLDEFKPIDTITKEDLVSYFNQFKGAETSRAIYAIGFKVFFKSIGKPDIASWLKVKRPKETLKSDDILDGADVNAMMDATDSPYWKALIAILYDSGGRISEIQALRYKDFIDTEEGLIIHIKSEKTGGGFRKMILPFASQYIRNLKILTNGKPDDIVFFHKYRYSFEILQEVGRRAKITKHISPHRFRHARATDEVRKGTQEAIIRKMLGWSATSAMIARYQHLSDNDVINSQLGKSNEHKITPLRLAEKVDVSTAFDEMKGLKEENQQLQERIKAMEQKQNQFNEDMVKAMIEARVKELMKK